MAVADLRGGARDARPPAGPNSFNFMQFLGKFGKIVCWQSYVGTILGELAPPPRGNPGSATEWVTYSVSNCVFISFACTGWHY